MYIHKILDDERTTRSSVGYMDNLAILIEVPHRRIKPILLKVFLIRARFRFPNFHLSVVNRALEIRVIRISLNLALGLSHCSNCFSISPQFLFFSYPAASATRRKRFFFVANYPNTEILLDF